MEQVALAVAAWCFASVPIGVVVGRMMRRDERRQPTRLRIVGRDAFEPTAVAR